MWTIEEGDREYVYGGGYPDGHGYAPPHGYGHSHGDVQSFDHGHSHGFRHYSTHHTPYASAYSVDMPALSPMVELKVDVHSERSRRAIIKKVSKLKGVTRVDVDLYNQKVTVTGNVTTAEVLKKVRKITRNAHVWMGMGDELHTSHHDYTPGYTSAPVTGAFVYTN